MNSRERLEALDKIRLYAISLGFPETEMLLWDEEDTDRTWASKDTENLLRDSVDDAGLGTWERVMGLSLRESIKVQVSISGDEPDDDWAILPLETDK